MMQKISGTKLDAGFLSAVWDADELGNLAAVHFITSLKPEGGAMKHYPVHTVDEALTKAAELSGSGMNAYFACARFLDPDSRKGENSTGARIFWFDIDCSEEKAKTGSGYATKKQGAKALLEFLSLLGIPFEAAWKIDSGNGIHAYLQLDVALDTNEWRKTAGKIKQLAAAEGFLADPSRTADIASVLRVPGTFNYKNSNDPKPVVLKHSGCAICYAELKAALDRKLQSASPIEVPQHMASTLPTLTPTSYPDSSFDLIRQRCLTLSSFADRSEQGEAISEPSWRNMLGVVKHTTGGEALGHELSRHDPRYDYAETQGKMDRWTVGPTLCQNFRSDPDSMCAVCTNTCKSPISLGFSFKEIDPISDVRTAGELEIPDTYDDVLSGRMFAQLMKNKLLYVASAGKWLRWDRR